MLKSYKRNLLQNIKVKQIYNREGKRSINEVQRKNLIKQELDPFRAAA
jgi:hypothetical protein